MTTKLYKVLDEDGRAFQGGSGAWSLPDGKKAGAWMPPVEGALVLCANGYHLCRRRDLIRWLGPAIYVAEARGAMIHDDTKVVVREARLVRRLETWNERTARLFAADCADHVLGNIKDARNRLVAANAVKAARAYARGKIDAAAMTAAMTAARSAESAAEAAARSAAESAAWSAAWSAERSWQTDRLFAYLGGAND